MGHVEKRSNLVGRYERMPIEMVQQQTRIFSPFTQG